ncbi:CDP-glucose 4,6-dehydratase [Haliscomenobacter hydrossis]|uniref:CDP-glucose 4,6-dehydratase n=1 Tax=Haliscomenobacter hydrossis (strain ATCC 27775 / DSM 1100 / LMG 10767 / O) TaxID=760192 RepID=F4KR33_HALH1|nr:CDP-glucose 4,6-dehydratase [Haliscomenobacter hydrossis]AEE53271.1 CDP-glucose 4,6-dehydratase [Haliscomenobacter hydrossis DSM 1100]
MEKIGKVNPSFWNRKKVYLTGHTGFKGSWLSLWLHSMGAEVKGYALDPPTAPALFEVAKIADFVETEIGDIRDLDKLTQSIQTFNPDVLLHLAAQSIVLKSYVDPIETYTTNVLGTANVLQAGRKLPNLKAIVSVTTDKCYENREWVWSYRENEPLGGRDPYSSSKACAELVTASFRDSFFTDPQGPQVATARAGNVIGGGDWTENGLIADIIRAFGQAKPVIVRNPLAIRPWQHVLEPLGGYLMLAEALYTDGAQYAQAWNFGPSEEDCKPVNWILDRMVNLWGDGASWELDQDANPHEARFLKLDSSKAAAYLGWTPQWRLEGVLDNVVQWHREWHAGADMTHRCLNDIATYTKLM